MASLNDLRPLTNLQYDDCVARAVKRVQRHIGERPTRAAFMRELGRLWTMLDIIALVVFIPALIVSSVHIITHMGMLAEQSYQAAGLNQAGTIISKDVYVMIHQWLMIPLAEGSMILFMVQFGLTRSGWRRWVYLTLAIVALGFVAVANVQSGIGALEAVLAPIFTIGIGLKLEHLIVQSLERRASVDNQYLQALSIWEAATADATAHPDYRPMLAAELWAQLLKTKSNQWATDAPPAFKLAAVNREQARERWAYSQLEPVNEWQAESEPVGPAARPEEVRATEPVPFGPTRRARAVSVNMPPEPIGIEPITSVNGHNQTN